MKVKDVFKEIINGFNLSNASTDPIYAKTYKLLKKESIQYSNVIEKNLEEKKLSSKIRDKYLMKPRDILISIKKPYRVGTFTHDPEKLNIVIPSNFIILRGINMDLYSYIFVANYLEKIGIRGLDGQEGNLKISDVEKIELPDIPKEKQMTISPLLQAINERSATYSNILTNDAKIVEAALHKVMGDKND